MLAQTGACSGKRCGLHPAIWVGEAAAALCYYGCARSGAGCSTGNHGERNHDLRACVLVLEVIELIRRELE